MLEELLAKLFGGQGGPLPTPSDQQLMPSELGVPPGGLMALLGGGAQQGGQTQELSAQSRQASPSLGGGIDFGEMLGRLGPALMMMSGDPNYVRAGAVMHSQQGKDRQTAREQQQAQQKLNQTYQWLVGQGMNPQQAALIAQDPTALREYLKPKEAKEPTLTETYDDKGRPVKGYMQGGKFVPVGGAKTDLLSPEAVAQKKEIAEAGRTTIEMNANQSTAAGFADRMANSERVLQQVETAGTSFWDQAAANVPFVGNYMTSDKFKIYDQAKRDFVNAALRRESGAVISPTEFENAEKQYFPQPGDSPKVIEQKRKNREVVMHGVTRAAGPNYRAPEMPGVTGPGDSSSGWTDLGGGVRIREKK